MDDKPSTGTSDIACDFTLKRVAVAAVDERSKKVIVGVWFLFSFWSILMYSRNPLIMAATRGCRFSFVGVIPMSST